MDEKMEMVGEILGCDVAALTPETRLDTLAWDSMAMLSVMSAAQMAGHSLDGDQIRAFETVSDLLAVL